MALETRTVWSPNYYRQGWIYGPPRVVVIHCTRSGQAHFDHTTELAATVGWFQNPNSQASAQWVISPTDRVRMVPDEYPSWHAGWHNFQGPGIEVTQPTLHHPFERGHYENLAIVCVPYVAQGIPIVRLPYLGYAGSETGFVGHEDTEQGRAVGKSDPGPMFDWARFFAELQNRLPEEEDDMKLLFYRYGNTIYAIRPDAKARKISLGEWQAHYAAGSRYIQVNKDPSKIAKA